MPPRGVGTAGGTGTGTDAFGLDCGGSPVVAEEALHTFTLTERRRVRLEAAGVPDATTGAHPGLRVGIYGTGDPGATRLERLEHRGRDCHRSATLETFLDAGTYTALVEGNQAG